MIGKKIRVNEYKLTYGQETQFLNIYGVFKNKKTGNKYAIYSYESNQNILYYGTFFQRNSDAVIMKSKENPKELIKNFIDLILDQKEDKNFEILSLDKIETVQIIDEYQVDFKVDINKLDELTIEKPIIKEEVIEQKKKNISLANIFFTIFLLVIVAFFIVNPEIIIGKNKYYSCTKTYFHEKLPATITEEIKLTFSGKGVVTNIEEISNYVFRDADYYTKFKENSYFYQYIEEGDTYKFVDEEITYRLFSKIDKEKEYFLPTEESELIKYYMQNKYTCKAVEEDE